MGETEGGAAEKREVEGSTAGLGVVQGDTVQLEWVMYREVRIK